MRIELQFDQETALDLHRVTSAGDAAKASPGAAALKTANALGVQLQPVHPGQTHPLLAPFFFIEVPDDDASARRIIDRFRKLKGVEAAYIRPSNEAP
jgi:hypothetical protein